MLPSVKRADNPKVKINIFVENMKL